MCASDYRRAYAADHTLVSPKTFNNRFDTFQQAVVELAQENVAETETIPACNVGSALHTVKVQGELCVVPARIGKKAMASSRGRAGQARYVYNLEVGKNHNYIAGRRGVLVGNSHSYAPFTGRIGKGYGEGMVTREDLGQAKILKASPDKINFVVAHHKNPENYSLVKVGEKNWLLVNTTKQDGPANKYNKIHYAKVDPDKVEQFLNWNYAASPKVDGSQILLELFDDKIRATSYRARKDTGGPIEHTERLGLGTAVPQKGWAGTVLKGEAYATKGGKVLLPQELGGLLNSSMAKSLERQKREGIQPKVGVFDIHTLRGQPPPPEYRKRLEIIKQLIPAMSAKGVHAMPVAANPKEARKMYEQIRGGKHPLTREGMVFTPYSGGVPHKLKLEGEESDVYIKNVFPADTKEGARAGGFDYSITPDGPVVGRVGSGFNRSVAEDMLKRPAEYVGRVARIGSYGQFSSGAHKAPVFKALHEDYPLAKEAALGLFLTT